MMNQGRIRIAPANPTMSTLNRPRDPRLEKMRNQPMEQNMHQKVPQQSSFPVMPPNVNIRGLPRIPKHNKSSSSTSRNDRDDPRKRRENDGEDKSSSSRHSRKSSSSSSSSKASPTKKSSHESSRKKDDERKSSKSSSSHKSSRSHMSSSKSPSKGTDDTPKDVDLRVHKGDVDMRPDSTTVAAVESKVNKNKLLNDLLQDEDMRSSQDSLISTSNDNGKEIISRKVVDCIIINSVVLRVHNLL